MKKTQKTVAMTQKLLANSLKMLIKNLEDLQEQINLFNLSLKSTRIVKLNPK